MSKGSFTLDALRCGMLRRFHRTEPQDASPQRNATGVNEP